MAVPLTFDQMVYLCQSDAVMVDFTVFEQAPQLQTGQQGGVDMTKSTVETIHRPQFGVLPQHHKLYLLHMSHSFSEQTRVKRVWVKNHTIC